MKKSILLLALGVFLLTGHIKATSVTPTRAQTIALNYYKLTVPAAAGNPSLSMSLVYTQTETDGTNDFYIYNVSPMKGFVIVSGDDNATPVIAYSTESNFVLGDYSRIGLSDWMKSSATKIHYIVTNHILADANISNKWNSYAQGVNPQNTRSGSIGPLCATTWNQVPYYNSLCPPAALASNNANKSVTGCVATAMAQIMKYWNYPAQGVGSHTYADDSANGYSRNYGTLSADFTRKLNWSAMPNNVTSDTDPVDSLMYELGVSVEMDYAPTGSGALVLISETAYPGNTDSSCSQYCFAKYFLYNPHTLQGVHLSSYTTSAWITLMENEINSGRVVQYEGNDPTQGGHTWVMDGYDANDNLHMNWGWGGTYDGFFAVTNLATPGFNPSQQDAALIGIEPLLPFSITLSPTSSSICPNGNTTLTAQGPASATYTWTPATGLSCTTCANPTASPTSTTLYTVKVDSAGVIGTLSAAVSVVNPVTAGFTFNAAASCNLPENVAFINSSTNATGYVWNFGDGSPTSATPNPIHPYTIQGSYTVELISTNACGADSIIQTQAVQITGGAPTAPNVSICSGQSVTINASGTNISWYSDPAGSNSLQQSVNTYTTPVLTSTTTYYLGSFTSPSPVSVGPANDAISAASEYTSANAFRGLTFDNSVNQTLNSVIVYATGAGNRTFVLEDSLGNVIDSATMPLINGEQTVQLGFNLPAGNGMVLGIIGTTNLARNSSGAVYPYISTDGSLSITGNNAGAQGRYYFFYNWQIQQPGCSSALTPVTVFVLNSGGYYFTATGTGTPTVNFTPGDTSSANTYTWNFGDGSNPSMAVSPTHTYATGGIYTVQLIVSNGNCADTVSKTINTLVLGINDINALSSANVYPNPATNLLTLSVNSSKQYAGCQLNISNVIGQNVYGQEVDLSSGANKFDIDIANLRAGVYIISLQNGKDMVTSKFVKD